MDNVTLWIALFVALGALVLVRGVWGKKRVKIVRMNEDTLQTARKLVLPVLRHVEDGHSSLLDSVHLPSTKANVKSAMKLLVYYYWKTSQSKEMARLKSSFVALSRFQDGSINDETREKVRRREAERFREEIDQYISQLS